MEEFDIAIVGAGAAGCFAGAVCGEITQKQKKIVILEKTKVPLAKVKISGGGRCNVTHACFDGQKLIAHYPRGKQFLQNVFYRFQPRNMVEWLEERGVPLKEEKDGRMFPVTNVSSTICNCFLQILQKQEVELRLEQEVEHIASLENGLCLSIKGRPDIYARKVLFSTGGMHRAYPILQEIGHSIIPAVPSLFTFEIAAPWLHAMSGVTIPNAKAALLESSFQTQGPILLTHWGLSGPSILKLSAFAARYLSEKGYKSILQVNWIAEENHEHLLNQIKNEKQRSASKKVTTTPLFSLPKHFWKELLLHVAGISEDKVWAHVSLKEIQKILFSLIDTRFEILGKSLNKEEFVTCGGVALEEIDPKTMQSRKVKNLYFAGEVMDIDGITGGFNFQSAWSTAWIAAHAMTTSL